MKFVSSLHEYQAEANCSSPEFAARLGISLPLYEDVLCGTVRLCAESQASVAARLGVDPAAILEFCEPSNVVTDEPLANPYDVCYLYDLDTNSFTPVIVGLLWDADVIQHPSEATRT